MSEQELEQKKKKKKLDYTQLIEDAKTALEENDNSEAGKKYFKRKSEIINKLADDLKMVPDIEQHRISLIIKQELKNIVSESYINDVLPPEYKDEKQSNRAKGGKHKDGNFGNGNAAESKGDNDGGSENKERSHKPETEDLTEGKGKLGYLHIEPKDYLIEDLEAEYAF
jgi:hypothetical protein